MAWYGSTESKQVARTVLLLQKTDGGWPKNVKIYNKALTDSDIIELRGLKAENTEATIDNGATYGEMVFLAKMYQATKDSVYQAAFLRGMTFIFTMQYPNGGFKQFDRTKGYYTHITYNDNAMCNMMHLLRAIVSGNSWFEGLVCDSVKRLAGQSFDKGIDCILKTQYVQQGKKTVWCAQHDENTLLPAKARAYELPSLSGFESVNLVLLLMDIPKPDQRIKDAINGAMAWFDANRISDHRIERYANQDGKPDIRWVKSSEGPDLWGRFCELQSNKAFVCDRDGMIKYDLAEIGYERRTGYGWYTDQPNVLFPVYEKWKATNMPSIN